jgi:hypothetical protein
MMCRVFATFRLCAVLVLASASPIACGQRQDFEPSTTVRGMLEGPTSYGPAVSSWGPGRLDVFWRKPFSQNLEVSQLTFPGDAWAQGDAVPAPSIAFGSDPAAVSWGTDRIDLFWAGSDNHLRHRPHDSNGWQAVEDVGGNVWSTPASASWGSGRLDVFWRGADNHLEHKWSNDGVWSSEEDLGGTLTSAPAAVSWGSGRLDVFWRGSDDHLKHKWSNDGVWSGEEDLGGTLKSAPTVSSWGSGRLDVFWRGASDTLKHLWYPNFGAWSWEQDLGGTLASHPAAVSWGEGRIDVFWTSTATNAARLRHRWYPYYGNWSFDEDMGPLQAPVTCAVHDACGASGAYCELPHSGCTDTTGTCAIRPTACQPDIIPSCGCDGMSYANDCERQAAGVPKWRDGACSSQSCPGTAPQQGTACTPANMACTYAGPNQGCVRQLLCTNGVWSAPTVNCGF